MDKKKAYSPEELSEVYGLNVGTLANMRCAKRGPKYFKVGKKIIYFEQDIESWLRKNPVLTIDCDEVGRL